MKTKQADAARDATFQTLRRYLETAKAVGARDHLRLDHGRDGAIWFDFGSVEQCVTMALDELNRISPPIALTPNGESE